MPSFAIQTGQPCAACHVGSFGPQLTPFGRDFKMGGYVASDGANHGPPLAVTTLMSYTHTLAPQPGGAAPYFAANDNFAVDQTSAFYAGRVTPTIGAFAQLTLDGVARKVEIDNVDIRRAGEGSLFGQDLIWGLTLNNAPTVSDPWNSTPVWGFPYNASALAPAPAAAALIDNTLSQRVVGAGAYMFWNGLIYAEADVYGGLARHALQATGADVYGGPTPVTASPYGRLALVEDGKQIHFEVGGYGLHADVAPAGFASSGQSDHIADLAADGTLQYFFNPRTVTGDVLSSHATLIHEWASTPASAALAGSTPGHWLTTARADISYSIAATVTPSVQIFHTRGSTDAGYWSTPSGSPNTDGMIFEIAYVPWGKPDSPMPGLNTRLAVQYVDYARFNGASQGARNNNNVFVSLWTAVRF